jgi:periplasmic divalent cation tolerance protein
MRYNQLSRVSFMSPDEQITILYVPCGSEDEAAMIASTLLSERLIACANIHRSRSLYRWEATLVDEIEFVLYAKTTQARAATAGVRIGELHSDEIPCILTIRPDSVSRDYARWVTGEVEEQEGEVESSASILRREN